MSRWLAACVIAIALWGLWGLLFASASGLMSPVQVQVLTTVGLTPVVVGLMFTRAVRRGTHFRRGMTWGLVTGLCGTLGTIFMAAALAMGGEASIVTPLTAMFPLVTAILAVVFLRERLNAYQIAGVAVALVAILLFSNAGAAQPTDLSLVSLTAPWIISALSALALCGIAGVSQKLSTRDISDELSTICYWIAAVTVAIGILATQPFDWTLAPEAWALVLATGVVMGLALWVGFAAYRDGKASVVTALIALYPVVTVALAVPILGEGMNAIKALAIGLALIAGLALGYERPRDELTSGSSRAMAFPSDL